MPINGLRPFYYERFPIAMLDYFDVPTKRTGGIKTGGMGAEEFTSLVESIKTNGLINPIIVEDNNTSLKVQLGNNRIWALLALGETHVKAIVITKNCKGAPYPGAEEIPIQYFESRVMQLHPGDETWRKSYYAKLLISSFKQLPIKEVGNLPV